jgi:hypothetical protein
MNDALDDVARRPEAVCIRVNGSRSDGARVQSASAAARGIIRGINLSKTARN